MQDDEQNVFKATIAYMRAHPGSSLQVFGDGPRDFVDVTNVKIRKIRTCPNCSDLTMMRLDLATTTYGEHPSVDAIVQCHNCEWHSEIERIPLTHFPSDAL